MTGTLRVAMILYTIPGNMSKTMKALGLQREMVQERNKLLENRSIRAMKQLQHGKIDVSKNDDEKNRIVL